MSQQNSILAFLIVVAALSCCQGETATLGVQDKYIQHFKYAESAGVFRCLDSSAEIPFSKVNDEYCDCSDGSDEPGTSACVVVAGANPPKFPDGWMFQCSYEATPREEVPHGRVNDGFCDCCDGTDEPAGFVRCAGVCEKVLKERAERQAAEEKMRRKAMKERESMKTNAENVRKRVAKDLVNFEAELKKLSDSLEFYQKTVDELNEKEEAEKVAIKAAHTAWVGEYGDTVRADEDSYGMCIMWRQTGNCKATGPREVGNDRECTTVITSQQSGYCECVNDTEDYKNSAYHIDEDDDNELNDADDYYDEDGEGDAKASVHLYNFSCKHEPFQCSYVCSHQGEAGIDKRLTPPPDGSIFVLPAAAEARRELQNSQNRISELESKIAEYKERLSKPANTEDILRTLEGSSFTIDNQAYTYELRLFENTFQHDKGSKGGPSLGKWGSFATSSYSLWSKDSHDFSHMNYVNGNTCWNGIVRSTEVHVVCGPENKLTHVEEPSMCHYKMVFETPAICNE